MRSVSNLLFVFATVLLLVNGCAKKAEIPAYIIIDSVKVLTNYATQGSGANGIHDAWVYVDNQQQGIYLLPLRFPVTGMGEHHFSISAGTTDNGQLNNHVIYPFYTTYDTTLTLEAEKVYHLKPVYHYKDAAQVVWIEDFENSNITLTKASDNETDTITRTSDPDKLYEPGYAGQAILKKNNEVFDWATRENFKLPGAGVDTYVEINYKSELPLEIGFYQSFSTGVQRYPIVVPYSTGTWKKMYIKMTDEITTQLIKYGNSTFAIYIKAINDADADKEILLDNLKLVHF